MATARTASRAIARSFNRRPTPHRLVASSSRCSAPPSLFTSSSRRHLATHADSSSAETSAPSAPKAQKGKPKLERGDYKKVTKEDVEFFRSVLGEGGVISSLEGDAAATSQSELDSFNNDWMGKYFGTSKVVLKPRTTEQVSRVVAHCVKNRIAVCPQGGNTGLVGGSVPVFDEVIISLAGLSKIRAFDETSGILTCDAGCILQTLDEYVGERGYIIPLDLGAKGSCHIGGNVATNAGGLRLLRYGSLHGSVLGLEVVLPDEKGTILSNGMQAGLRKDNTGYDLKQLFIGSEGTLGLITGVCILTPKRPAATNVAVLKVPDYSTIQKVFKETRANLGEILSAFEFFDQEAMDMVLHHTGQKQPFESEGEGRGFYILIETSGSNKDHDDEKLAGLLESLLESSTIADGVLAQDENQLRNLWSLRESIPEAGGKLGKVYKYDLSLPVSEMYSLIEDIRGKFDGLGLVKDGSIKTVVGYGHIGDGNLHVNIVADRWDPKIEEAIEPWIYEWTASRHGSISAEHGLGVMKAPYIGYSKDATNVAVMKTIKDAFDPQRILNPNKYFLTGSS